CSLPYRQAPISAKQSTLTKL
uniref:Variable lymphocyte receptor A cassette n=1 Tax=Globodera pallida TaxID=36090 RepID=A0A183CQ12_GLOPA